MTSFKVAHITTISASLRYLLLNQLRFIQDAGYEVTGISATGPEVAVLEQSGIAHINVPMTRTLSPVADLFSLFRLYRVIRQERFTIVHTHNPKPGLLGQLAAKMAGTPIIVNTLHGFYFHENMPAPQKRFFIGLEKIAARCSDVVLSQNREDVTTAIAHNICTPEQIKYLGNGIDLEQFSPHGISSSQKSALQEKLGITRDSPVVGFVGRLASRRKGFLDFLRAGEQVARAVPGVQFLIVGAPDHGKPDSVRPSRARDYNVADRCIFLGHRPNDELPAYYSMMDVLVLPSLFEGVPRAVMEAAAMGVPAVVTNVRGNREAVEHNCNGLLVPLGDVPTLADAIVTLLTDGEMRTRMGQGGRQIANEYFDERLVFAKVKAEYARLLQEKGFPLPISASNG